MTNTVIKICRYHHTDSQKHNYTRTVILTAIDLIINGVIHKIRNTTINRVIQMAICTVLHTFIPTAIHTIIDIVL